MLVETTNDTCVKYYMAPQAYKVVSTHAHEISIWTFISRLLYSRAPNIGEMNGDVWSDLSTMEFKNREQLEYFIAQFSDLNRKLSSLEKFYLLKDFYYSTPRNFKISTDSYRAAVTSEDRNQRL